MSELGSFTHLTVEDRGPARVVTVNRPKALNALNGEVLRELLVESVTA